MYFMSYQSVDKLQKVLASKVFNHTKDPKKAAGRALGTLVEIIAYYILKTWGLNSGISIERGLEEYGNPEIVHNVEFSLHPLLRETFVEVESLRGSVTTRQVFKKVQETNFQVDGYELKQNKLLEKGVVRNACTVAASVNSFLLSSINKEDGASLQLRVYEQHRKPYAIFECKRVGVEEGMKKGPQTIEKAKQGAYVARTASSLQKIRTESGQLHGIIYRSNGTFLIRPFVELMEEVINSEDPELLRRFILTIGVVSNHGNWFTSENPNKELKVLSQSYDWLLFLTDQGLSEFIDHLLFNPDIEQKCVREAFLSSYMVGKKKNQFTKVQMNKEADRVLTDYFIKNQKRVESWFNVISPGEKRLSTLRGELDTLKNKNWEEILK